MRGHLTVLEVAQQAPAFATHSVALVRRQQPLPRPYASVGTRSPTAADGQSL
jgi:hypothetical protein